MSTWYKTSKDIRMNDLFDGRLEAFGVKEVVVDSSTSSTSRCLTDTDGNWLWCFGEDAVEFKRFGVFNVGEAILGVICEAFNTTFISEYEPQYWGFETREEFEAFMNGDDRAEAT